MQFGGSTLRPNRFDGSASGDFNKFTPGANDDDPLAFSIASNTVNAILWFVSTDALIAGTLGDELVVRSDRLDGPITPTNITAKSQTHRGSFDREAIVAGDAVLFWQRHAKKLIEAIFSFDANKYVAGDLTQRAEHITRGGIVDMAFQPEPWGIVWIARADGTLLGCTYLRDENVVGWHRHPLGGNGAVEAVSVIPGAGSDELWLIVRRTINGQTKRYIELLEDFFPNDADVEDAFFVDCGLTLDNAIDAALTPGAGATAASAEDVPFIAGAAVFTAGDVGRFIRHRYDTGRREDGDIPVYATAIAEITGFVSGTQVTATIRAAFPSLAPVAAKAWRLTVTQVANAHHLEGETVDLLVDGAVHPQRTVVGGAVELDSPAGIVHLGYSARAVVKPMRLEAGAAEGTAQGRLKRIHKIAIRFFRSMGCKFGPDETHLEALEYRTIENAVFDAPLPLFTGDMIVSYPGAYEARGDILIVQDEPLPATVVSLAPQLATYEG